MKVLLFGGTLKWVKLCLLKYKNIGMINEY